MSDFQNSLWEGLPLAHVQTDGKMPAKCSEKYLYSLDIEGETRLMNSRYKSSTLAILLLFPMNNTALSFSGIGLNRTYRELQ